MSIQDKLEDKKEDLGMDFTVTNSTQRSLTYFWRKSGRTRPKRTHPPFHMRFSRFVEI